ncbi:MAG: hypothetical protein MJ048_03855 [Acidaminococcaceae bacterium]|nr:hypothetical protein [Acidaminococcaceae bacterium]
MLLGIDVGGTFTDGVLIEGAEVLAQAKRKTTHENVLHGILAALDAVLGDNASKIERVVISSTIVTNALTEHKLDPVFLATIPGPGMNTKGKFPVEAMEITGYIDHRGKCTAPINWTKHRNLTNMQGKGAAAVSGKFSVRDSSLERELAKQLKEQGFSPVFRGAAINGELNFVRRTNSAYYAAATYELFNKFAQAVQRALKERSVFAPIFILKADGGTLPLEEALKQPVEAIFTGPAASVLGIEALVAPDLPAISLDVGGTTTDIAFWEHGSPLMAKHGAIVDGYPTAVRTFHMRSVGIGGDSAITKNADGTYQVGPKRQGTAAALGGAEPTFGDALVVSGRASFGDVEKSVAALSKFGDAKTEAEKIVAAAVTTIKSTIDSMLEEWAVQPVYTVEDVLKGTEFQPKLLVGVGGGANGLINALGEEMGLQVQIPKGAMVANAIGAALSRPTLSAGLRADTTEGFYLIAEEGQKRELPGGFGMKKAESILSEYLRNATAKWNLPDQEVEIISKEFFNTIHGYYDSGEIINLRMQLKPGVLNKLKVKSEKL